MITSNFSKQIRVMTHCAILTLTITVRALQGMYLLFGFCMCYVKEVISVCMTDMFDYITGILKRVSRQYIWNADML